MAGLWRNNPATPEGKYPIVLRRDGTPLETRYIVLGLRDPCTPAALWAYGDAVDRFGLDKHLAWDIRQLAREADVYRQAVGPGDPDAPPHRPDNLIVLAWARSIGNPGS